jgi:biotin-(acetyl-CoA carboxylase) ligase
MLTEGADPDMELLAEAIDMLERLCKFVQGLGLKLHMGHVLSDLVVGAARALVSLGDVKSQKYASEWLKRIAGYVEHFESDGMQKVVSALQVAWTRQSGGKEEDTDTRDANKRARIS